MYENSGTAEALESADDKPKGAQALADAISKRIASGPRRPESTADLRQALIVFQSALRSNEQLLDG